LNHQIQPPFKYHGAGRKAGQRFVIGLRFFHLPEKKYMKPIDAPTYAARAAPHHTPQ
jgi:hypothetical protein